MIRLPISVSFIDCHSPILNQEKLQFLTRGMSPGHELRLASEERDIQYSWRQEPINGQQTIETSSVPSAMPDDSLPTIGKSAHNPVTNASHRTKSPLLTGFSEEHQQSDSSDLGELRYDPSPAIGKLRNHSIL